MKTLIKLFLFTTILSLYSCATHEKTQQFQMRVQKIVTESKYQDNLLQCYAVFLKKNQQAEGNVIINYTILSEVRKEITLGEISPSLNDVTFTNCLIQQAEKIDFSKAYDSQETERIYRGTVSGSYSFKKSFISPKH